MTGERSSYAPLALTTILTILMGYATSPWGEGGVILCIVTLFGTLFLIAHLDLRGGLLGMGACLITGLVCDALSYATIRHTTPRLSAFLVVLGFFIGGRLVKIVRTGPQPPHRYSRSS